MPADEVACVELLETYIRVLMYDKEALMKLMILLAGYVVFGIIDNLVMYCFGNTIEQGLETYVTRVTRGRYRVKKDKRGVTVGIAFLCAGIGNAVSDFVGGMFACNIGLAVLSFIGCMIVVLVVILPRTFERVSQ